MARRNAHMPELMDVQRGELLRRAHGLWQASCAAGSVIDFRSPDGRVLSELTASLCAFALGISRGKTDFARLGLPTSPPQVPAWRTEEDRYEASVDEALAVCGGDERATIRGLLVLADFLELEAYGKMGTRYRGERPAG